MDSTVIGDAVCYQYLILLTQLIISYIPLGTYFGIFFINKELGIVNIKNFPNILQTSKQ